MVSPKEYEKFSISDPKIRLCFRRGFFPLGDNVYIDEFIVKASGLNELIIISEIETMSIKLIDEVVEMFEQNAAQNEDLPFRLLQNMASWMFAWALEMSWYWKKDIPDKLLFQQDMDSFRVPMSKFELIPQDWVADLVEAFLFWSYNASGYTDRHEIDIYDPIRDGYLTMIRCTVTKALPQL